MSGQITVGDMLQFEGSDYRLLPELQVTFGGGATVEEPPMKVPSPEEAYQVVRERSPKAHWQRWNEQDGQEWGHDGYCFDPIGKHDEFGQIYLFFYREPSDVMHEEFRQEFRQAGSISLHQAGWITWFLARV
jgi:hypothetical protein